MENRYSKRANENELPSHYADRLGLVYASSVNQQHKKENGQFFTPVEIAALMASFSEFKGNSVRLLDPGCGSVVLSCAIIEHIISIDKDLKNICLVVYETDNLLIPITKMSIDYLEKWAEKKGIQIKTEIFVEDFILSNTEQFKETNDLFSKPIELFDIIISNPPYFKLPIDDKRVIAAKMIVNGHPNIYAIFMTLSAKMLKEGGELIFITPRSYAAGGYFKKFREYFFKIIDLEKVHLFVSRKDTFGRDKVLQETVIIKGTKRKYHNDQVEIFSTYGLKDIDNPMVKIFRKKDIIDIESNEKILFLPTDDNEEGILEIFRNWEGNLKSYEIKISTGPVVSFRAVEYIRENFENGTVKLVPLFWLHNVKQMLLEWPLVRPKKGQYIKSEEGSRSILIPNKNYVFLRRFSSKDDKSRLIAAPYFCNFIDTEFIGVENKVNYIYRKNGHLERNEVIGICALLNSSLFDAFFRIFNGNVNVSATELREMSLPPLETIKEIGDSIIISNDFSTENTNRVVNEIFEPVYKP